MTVRPITLHIRYQIWSTSPLGDYPAGFDWFDSIEDANRELEKRRREIMETEKKEK